MQKHSQVVASFAAFQAPSFYHMQPLKPQFSSLAVYCQVTKLGAWKTRSIATSIVLCNTIGASGLSKEWVNSIEVWSKLLNHSEIEHLVTCCGNNALDLCSMCITCYYWQKIAPSFNFCVVTCSCSSHAIVCTRATITCMLLQTVW